MGTVTIGISRNDLHSDIDIDLFNKLGIGANPKLSVRDRSELKLVKKHSFMIRDGYDRHTYGFINNKFIFIASSPQSFFHKKHDYRITIHFSQWQNVKSNIDDFCDIFGSLNTQEIFNVGEILRIDAWLDTECSYDFLRKSIFRKGVSVSDQVKSDLRTYYMGSRKPTPALFYEKKGLNKNFIDIKSNHANEEGITTRIEVRFLSPKVPIVHFSDYGLLAEMNLFSKLLTSVISTKKFVLIQDQFSDKRVQLFKKFLISVHKEGIHSARRTFNRNRDFARMIQPVLDKCSVDLELSEKWKHKVRTRLVGGLDIRKYLELKVKQELERKI